MSGHRGFDCAVNKGGGSKSCRLGRGNLAAMVYSYALELSPLGAAMSAVNATYTGPPPPPTVHHGSVCFTDPMVRVEPSRPHASNFRQTPLDPPVVVTPPDSAIQPNASVSERRLPNSSRSLPLGRLARSATSRLCDRHHSPNKLHLYTLLLSLVESSQ